MEPVTLTAVATAIACQIEPIFGGGLFTAAAPPLITRFGPIPILLLTSSLLVFWLIFGFYNCRQIRKENV